MATTKLDQANAIVERFLQHWERKVTAGQQIPALPEQRKALQTFADWLVERYTIQSK